MIYLLIVSLIWAFSFGLIKTNLTSLDSNFVSFIRLFISFLVFLPVLRINNLNKKVILSLIGIGVIQFGMMYLVYIHSYQFLQAYEVALFTIFTPIYITLINDIISKKFNMLFFVSALIAVIGAGIILYKNIDSIDFVTGFWLVQLSNLCFASGQIFYSKVVTKEGIKNNFSIFGLLYLGAAIVTFIPTLITTDLINFSINKDQIFTLLYLGVVSSGLCFYLWNIGVTKTNKGILAIFNNAKIPLAVFVSIFFFGEEGSILKLTIGAGIIIVAFVVNEYQRKRSDVE